MIRQLTLAAALTLGRGAGAALAAGGAGHVEDYHFSFEGPFGSYDQMQLQRGLQVYTEICSACHGLQYVPLRTLGDPGGPELPEDQVRAYAEFYEIFDPTLFDGEGDFRLATPNDHFPGSNLSNAPDLSLMAKGRAGFHGPYGLGSNQFFRGMGGAEYIASLLAGYTGEEKEEEEERRQKEEEETREKKKEEEEKARREERRQKEAAKRRREDHQRKIKEVEERRREEQQRQKEEEEEK